MVLSSGIGAFNYQTVGHTAFAVGRFLSAFAGLIVKPRRILLVLFIGLIVTSALATTLTGDSGVAMIVLIMFFESGIFCLIYTICLRGLGARTKDGSVWLTVATSGGAVIPAVASPVVAGHGVQYSFVVVVAIFAVGLVFPVYLALTPAAKAQVDPHHHKPNVDAMGTNAQAHNGVGRMLSSLTRRKAHKPDLPPSEHEKEPG